MDIMWNCFNEYILSFLDLFYFHCYKIMGHKETKISIRLILSQATKISAYSSQDSLVKMLLRNTFKLKTIILISIGQTFITGPNSTIDLK